MTHEMGFKSRADFGPELPPPREFMTGDGYRWFVFSAEATGIPLVCLEDINTGVIMSTLISHPTKRMASLRAWSGARHSRAPGYAWDILNEIIESNVDSDQKIEKFFFGYGHASPGDMAYLGVHIENVPMHTCMSIFNNLSLNGGQEKSTRYQTKFGNSPVQSLENYLPHKVIASPDGEMLARKYHELASTAAPLFAKYKAKIEQTYQNHFAPNSEAENRALIARTLDTARVFLLLGQQSSQYVGDTARNFSRLIGELKGSKMPLYGSVARQLEKLLAPSLKEEEMIGQKAEAPALMRHTEVSGLVNENMTRLRSYIEKSTDFFDKLRLRTNFRGRREQTVEYLPRFFTEAERLAAEYMMAIWPGLDHTFLLNWISTSDAVVRTKMGEIIFMGHNNIHELPSFARTTGMTAIVNGSLAEVRDLNRHRSSGRFIELPIIFGLSMTGKTFKQILAKGFVLPLYLTDVEDFIGLGKEIEEDLLSYYEGLYELADWTDKTFGDSIDHMFQINLLPFAHQISIWLHFDPKSAVYTPKLRYKPGGQINYRQIAWYISQEISRSDPLLSSLAIVEKPNPASRAEFFDRG